jgi:hypothetical protein
VVRQVDQKQYDEPVRRVAPDAAGGGERAGVVCYRSDDDVDPLLEAL